jgi:transposase
MSAEIKAQDQRINRLCNANDLSKRFLDVPGVGPLTATIVAADIGGSGKGYKSSRDYAASLGVVPKQHSGESLFLRKLLWASLPNKRQKLRDR